MITEREKSAHFSCSNGLKGTVQKPSVGESFCGCPSLDRRWILTIKHFIVARWIVRWNSLTTAYRVQSGRRNVGPGVNAGHQSLISLSKHGTAAQALAITLGIGCIRARKWVASCFLPGCLALISFSLLLLILSRDWRLTPSFCVWMWYLMVAEHKGHERGMLSSRIRVIFKQSPSPQHLAVLFISTHTLHTRLQALICCPYQGRHSVLNTLPPDSLSFSLSPPLLHHQSPGPLLMSLAFFLSSLSPKS